MTDSENGIAPEWYELVEHARRRRLCQLLAASDDDEWSLDGLAERLVGREPGGTPVPRSVHVRRVAIALHHTHLPKLDEAGVVEYDPAARSINVRDHPLLDAIDADGE